MTNQSNIVDMGGLGSGLHNKKRYMLKRDKIELILLTPVDSSFIKYLKCPNCHMKGGYYSNGVPQEHLCTNCWKLCYN